MFSKLAVFVLTAIPASQAVVLRSSDQTLANPVRKVVTLLQKMQKKVTEEGEKEEELYKKFMCYCRTGKGDLEASIQAANTKAPQLASDIKASEEELAQLKADLKQAQTDRADAKTAMGDATGIREKEAKAFAQEEADLKANIDAITKAVAALEKGMAGGFLQTSGAQRLKNLVLKMSDMSEDDRNNVLSFLSGKQDSDYAPSSGEITGILKTMGDEMKKDLTDITDAENSAIKTYEELMTAKKKEVDALTNQIETKTERSGELGVSIVQMKNDLTDTEAQLMEDQAVLKELSGSCDTKSAEWETRKKTRAEELVAIAETIKILNDDDALELFKKTLPAPSLMQVEDKVASIRARALELIQKASHPKSRADLDVIMLALSGKKIGFEKVIKMIDDMIATLKQEQLDDDSKQEYCGKQFDEADDKKKDLERDISDAETAIANAEEGIATAKDDIAKLEKSIKDLDKMVADATELRKEEHEEYKDLMASDGAAKELLGFAKNRLNKFYNPKLYKPPAKEELSSMDRISENMGGASLAQGKIPPAPETWGAYSKKGQESTGVIQMINLLITDLDKEMTEAETEEKNGQKEYEKLMADSAAKRTEDSKGLTEATATKADLEAALQKHTDEKRMSTKELMVTEKFIASLHAECDWLLKYFDARKEARAEEIDSLGKAKAVLSGADYSL
jgi:chromosome segregation ATPase